MTSRGSVPWCAAKAKLCPSASVETGRLVTGSSLLRRREGPRARLGGTLAAGWASVWKHLPSAQHGARAEGSSVWEEGTFAHLWHWGVWRGWESKQGSSRCSAAQGGLKSLTSGRVLCKLLGSSRKFCQRFPGKLLWKLWPCSLCIPLNAFLFQMASAGPVHELPSLGNSLVWLEGKRQELNVKTTQVSARKDFILQSVFDVLKENGVHGLKREVPLLMQRGHPRALVGKAGRTIGFLHSFPPQSLPRHSCSPIFLLATAGLSKDLRATWSSSCRRKSVPWRSPSGTSPRRSLPQGKSAVPPKTLLSWEWMRPKVKLSWGYLFMTCTERSPRPSTCRRSPAKPLAVSNWRCGAIGEMQNTPACTEWKFTELDKRQQRFLEGNN
ncbi:uncharacterized protein LOC116238947 isoform X2 [Phasianus colchicus]|uniref:uncharacterized protein LOC116238947 isoform X2 n=1 Tax=Phasianus colchicus TaxID=9054 RepID=UPI00129E7609|nr:uncharacterized protein LOC116238947 isoform X2 [Phasianus colchicus]